MKPFNIFKCIFLSEPLDRTSMTYFRRLSLPRDLVVPTTIPLVSSFTLDRNRLSVCPIPSMETLLPLTRVCK